MRFPNGQTVRYNDANYLQYTDRLMKLWKGDPDKKGAFICCIPYESGAIVEFVRPCAVENPLTSMSGQAAIEYVINNAEELAKLSNGGRLLSTLKKKLAGFSTRYRRFK